MPLFRAHGFGLNWQADFPLEQFDPIKDGGVNPDIIVERTDELPKRHAVKRFTRGATYEDGFRFKWHDEVVFDVYEGNLVQYCPLKDWTGQMPSAFFSTIVALTLAMRGMIPMHATAVQVSGQAILFAGKPGAGKSTLAAELISAGASLISDDLTILRPGKAGAAPTVLRGRRTIRLHPETAADIVAERVDQVPEDPRGKLLVWPSSRTPDNEVPLAGLVVLGKEYGRIKPLALAPMLPELLFRPTWMAEMPGKTTNRLSLLEIAKSIKAITLPRISGFSEEAKNKRSEMLKDAVQSLVEP